MTTIVTRTGKGSPLSTAELDGNFTNLNTDKVETSRAINTTAGELTGGGTLAADKTLGLATVLATPGTINNSATTTTPITVDAKGRITAFGTSITLAPSFANISGKPTTIAGYGITDAQAAITGGASTITSSNLTASKALASDSGGKVVVSNTTAAELAYLSGVTSSVQNQIDAKQSSTAKNAAGGYAGLDSNGLIPTNLLPALAISDTFVVATQAAMLALTAQRGDVAVRTDLSKSFILATDDPTLVGNWQELLSPPSAVSSVAGKTGAVTLISSDVSLGNVTNDAQLKIASNLADLNNAATARTNLGVAIGTNVQAAVTATGILKGAGSGSVGAATAGTDYLAPPSGTAILKAANGGALANATAGTDYLAPAAIGTTVQGISAELTAIAGISALSGLLKKTAAGTWSLDTSTYLTGNQSITVSGDATGSGTTGITLTLAASGATAGTYQAVTVNAKGLVTGGSNPTTLAGFGITDAQGTITASGLLKGAGAGSISAATAGTDYVAPATATSFSKAQVFGAATLTDGASIAWDASSAQVAQVTLGGNRTFAAPSNLVNGGFYALAIIQDATGSRTATWNTVFKFTGGTAPTLSTTANAKDYIVFRSDGTNLLEQGRSLGVA